MLNKIKFKFHVQCAYNDTTVCDSVSHFLAAQLKFKKKNNNNNNKKCFVGDTKEVIRKLSNTGEELRF